MQLISVVKIVMIILLFSSGQALAWTVAANFENGTVGTKAVGTSGFTDAGAQTVVTSGMAASGSKSAKMTWISGDTGFSNSMGSIDYSNIGYGSEIWARGYFYFASPWSWACSPAIKVFRIHVVESGANRGYISLLANSSGQLMHSNEVQALSGYPDVPEVQYAFGSALPLNQWVCLEIYIKFSATTPIVRMWRDGSLVNTETRFVTMGTGGGYSSDFSYVMSYWNGGVPQNQTQYVDEFIITNERPYQVDSNGNPMIGPINGQSVGAPQSSPPKAPFGLKSLPN